MKRMKRIICGAAIILAASFLSAQPASPAAPAPPPSDICTGAYFYQRACDTTWFAAWPGSGQPAGNHYQGCSAHTWIVHSEDGKDYPIKDQGSSQGTYKRAPDSAPSAQAAWDRCYNPPNQFEGGGSYHCADAIRPVGTLGYQMKPLFQVPNPPRASFTALYGCGFPTPSNTPTQPPGPSPTPGCAPCPCVTGTPTPNRTPTRTAPPLPTRRPPPGG